MGNIWITSDWHFGHQRDFIYEPRGFNNTYEMSEAIIKNHNQLVDIDDDVYCLGDCMLNDDNYGLSCIKQLKGRLHIIRGNHDSDTRIELYKQCYNIIEVCEGKFLNYKNYHFYLSHYPCLCGNYDDGRSLKKKTVSICGHTHTSNPFADWDKGLIFHAEADGNNCKLWNLDEIIKLLEEKTNEIH